MAIVLYGIKNCDTVKKARQWLTDHHIDYRFHDFRSDGLNPELLSAWLKQVGLEVLLNRSSTSFKQLSDADKHASTDEAKAHALILATPTLIKRPVLDLDGRIIVGFNAKQGGYQHAVSLAEPNENNA
ncbi:ArsC family reductase [Methylocucumis oryzae]|uniref:ArsC family transcriptional regulator n=1 Tax=Methylocucumis oryzae TaxID=1632867 RepID=A0A0F3IGI8_9GAMM|nr:ArsC family reductase [Methylocucumis oryzae]KJV05643.1 ArsC family transcriptional regulator [Methylocucumis oryzae]